MEIDYDKIAIEFIDTLDEGELTILAFGMIDHVKFKALMDMMFVSISEKITAPGKHYDGLDPTFLLENMKKDFKLEVEHKMACAIYRHARMVI